MTDLIERIEGAETGSRELSDAVLTACGFTLTPEPKVHDAYWRDADGWVLTRENISECITAALALAERVLPGWGWSAGGPLTACDEGAYARLDAPDGYDFEEAYAKTPALAMCAAILRAKESEDGR